MLITEDEMVVVEVSVERAARWTANNNKNSNNTAEKKLLKSVMVEKTLAEKYRAILDVEFMRVVR